MHHSKLLSLVKTFDSRDIRRAKQFVQSPYFNTNKVLINLFNYIIKFQPDYKHPKLEKAATYKALKLGGQFEDNKIRSYMSRLRQLLEKFIIHDKLDTNPGFTAHLLLDYHAQKSSFQEFNLILENRMEQLLQKPIMDTAEYLDLFLLFQKRYYHPDSSNYANRAADIQSTMQYLDLFFTSSKLNYSTELHNRKKSI